AAMGGFLEGRVTYELMASVWPTAARDPASTPSMLEFAPIWLDMPKLVFSRTLERVDWNSTIVREVVPEEMQRLKEQPGGDLLLGGTNLAATFRRHDLIDEYRLYVHPVLLGSGRPLFGPEECSVKLQLIEQNAFSNGVLRLRYRRPE